MPEPRAQLLQQYRSAGFNFVLLNRFDEVRRSIKKNGRVIALKKPQELGKAPAEKYWPDKTVDFNFAYEHMKGGKNVGVQMSTAGYAVIDYDPRNDPSADSDENSLIKLLKDADLHGLEHCKVLTGARDGPVRGVHIYVRIDPDWRGRTNLDPTTTKYPGIDFKHSPGQQVVAAGSVHPTGGHYEFDEDSRPMLEAQRATAKLLEIFEIKRPSKRAIGEGQGGWGRFSPEAVRIALQGTTERDGTHIPGLDVGLYTSDHDKWLELMMAVHFATGGEAGDEWVEWSTSDPMYAAESEIQRERWDTLNHETDVENPVTDRTMFKHFKDGGLDPRLWPRERIEHAFSDLTDEDLIIDAQPESEEARVLRIMNRDHAFVIGDREPLYVKPGISLVDLETPTYDLVSPNVLSRFYKNKFVHVQKTNGKGHVSWEKKSWFEFWDNHPQRREYTGSIYKPSADTTDIDMGDRGVYLNEFMGWPYTKLNRGRGQWKLFSNLIYRVLAGGNDRYYDYIIKWMAYSVQNPEGAQQVLMVFQGSKGVGKSLVAERWKRLFGSGGMTTQRMEDLTGQFNSRLRTTSALLMEEGIWAGDKTAENRLKQLVTGGSVQTEAKFGNSKETRNHLAIIMNTNEEWAVPATPDERRFAVFEAEEAWPKNDPYFGQVIREMDYEGGMQAFFYDLFHMDLEGWRPSEDIPMTPALKRQMATTMGPMSTWWAEILERGAPPMAFRSGEGPQDELNWGRAPIFVYWRGLKEDFRRYLRHNNVRNSKWSKNFDRSFKAEFDKITPKGSSNRTQRAIPETDEFFDVEGDGKLLSDGTRRIVCIKLPLLDECRKCAQENGAVNEAVDEDGIENDVENGDIGLKFLEETEDEPPLA